MDQIINKIKEILKESRTALKIPIHVWVYIWDGHWEISISGWQTISEWAVGFRYGNFILKFPRGKKKPCLLPLGGKLFFLWRLTVKKFSYLKLGPFRNSYFCLRQGNRLIMYPSFLGGFIFPWSKKNIKFEFLYTYIVASSLKKLIKIKVRKLPISAVRVFSGVQKYLVYRVSLDKIDNK